VPVLDQRGYEFIELCVELGEYGAHQHILVGLLVQELEDALLPELQVGEVQASQLFLHLVEQVLDLLHLFWGFPGKTN